MTRPLAVVALSGGVDSSVAAALLLEAGYRVRGISLRLWDSPRRSDRICSDHRDAARVAAALGIEHEVLDERGAFESRVVRPFVEEYAAGRTPNPCVACNSVFKLGVLLESALAGGAEVVATGHYARVRRDDRGAAILRARDPERDQSYFLFELDRRALHHVAFPLGELTKAEVRERARALGLPVAEKLDSQDLCFGSPATLVAARGAGGRAGEIVDESGRVLSRHAGVERFTIGQRRGLGIPGAAPVYVREIQGEAARVVISPRAPRSAGLVARAWNWLGSVPHRSEALLAQVRSRHAAVPARVSAVDGDRLTIAFDGSVAAVTPGQAVALYRGEELLGGGWIEAAFEARAA